MTENLSLDAFRRDLLERTTRFGIVGLGYVGLPLAVAFAEAGYRTIGVDVSSAKVDDLRAGRSYLMDVSTKVVGELTRDGRLSATTDYAALADTDVIFVCMPTPFDRAKAPDLSYIIAATEAICPVLRRGQLIILESTTYPGTTEEVLVPILERSGLKVGTDLHVAFSPERIDPGNREFTIANTPKVVGGIDAESTERAGLVLEQIVRQGGVHRVSTPRAAELTKLLENTFRAVNIALVNELAILCDRMGIDVWEVIDAAKTKPYGFMPFYPGPGVGGHCIPVDPYYLAWKAREYDFSTKFIEVAAETNQDMPFFTVDKLRRSLRAQGIPLDGARVLVLGAAFKKNIDDARNSSAVRVMEILRQEGAHVSYHDPHIPEVRLGNALYGLSATTDRLRSIDLSDEALRSSHAVLILVGHSAVDLGRVIRAASLTFDAVNATKGLPGSGKVVRL